MTRYCRVGVLGVFGAALIFSFSANAKKIRQPAESPAETESAVRIRGLEQSVEKLTREVETIKRLDRTNPLQTSQGFENQTYGKIGMSVLFPRQFTFPFETDTGLGAWLGIGQYFGQNHVADFNFEWDLYPSLSLRYRYEVHRPKLGVTFAPVVGYKVKAASLRPFDRFLQDPDAVKKSFFFFGGFVGFPMESSLLTLELIYLINEQSVMVTNLGLHLFI